MDNPDINTPSTETASETTPSGMNLDGKHESVFRKIIGLLLRPFVFVYHLLFFPPTTMMRFLIWTPLLIIALIGGSWAALGIGYIRYYYKGQPGDWQTRERQMQAQMLMSSVGFANRRNTGFQLFSLMPNIDEKTFLRISTQRGIWMHDTETDLYRMRRGDVPLEWDVNEDGKVTSARFESPGFHDSIVRNFHTRMRSTMMQPKVIIDPLTDQNNFGRENVWWSDTVIIIVRWRDEVMKPHADPEKVLEYEVIGLMDERFAELMEKYEALHQERIENDPAYIPDTETVVTPPSVTRRPQLQRQNRNQ